MPSEYIAQSYERLQSKYNEYYGNFSKEKLIKHQLSSQKENWQYKNSNKTGK